MPASLLTLNATAGKLGEPVVFTGACDTSAAPQAITDIRFADSNPEGICFFDFGPRADFLIVSDDGTRKINGKECKKPSASFTRIATRPETDLVSATAPLTFPHANFGIGPRHAARRCGGER